MSGHSNSIRSGHFNGRRLFHLQDRRLLRALPWRAQDREPILEALGTAQVPDAVDIPALRRRERLSQRDFARLYGLPLDTLKAWERGVRPSQPARAFLALIKAAPHLVRRTLGVAL
jgi:DNA-binding transcriptional regulator YiaG